MLLPVIGPLPQISHRCAIVFVLHKSRTQRGGIDNTGGGELQEYGSIGEPIRMTFITGKWRFETRERCQKILP
jgi:hypothetical protein